jgi:hypothetical protein
MTLPFFHASGWYGKPKQAATAGLVTAWRWMLTAAASGGKS